MIGEKGGVSMNREEAWIQGRSTLIELIGGNEAA
ncbi:MULTISPECIES: hypothetical protein [Bacillus]|uniref:Uncharacterized protein n=1 Tax=Bacillus subtilis TaxID=1423 RepID=A0AAQ3IF31_BACIU|nr:MULTISPECIES: hypothetical protein [Bacillus]AYK76935.1 hypothetical protein D9C20_01475 [Bacillus subtilis subsp. subtilis]AYK84100.1 hypothetical protein D9C18_18555 [Bacillus subtilis subsp. subtilis]AYK85004.1 hypothetical protein D9C16_00120 [Bacillus subtilis subsp. subtilis]AYK89771.1 hypothetical protein D9C17_03960 [Bacillus subtilis subsp. subtilis]MBE0186775.1 hypothetical protein [Bacillus subtilis]